VKEKLELLQTFSPRVKQVHVDVGEVPVSRMYIPFFSAVLTKYATRFLFEVHYMVREKNFFLPTHAVRGITRVFYPLEQIRNISAFEQGIRLFRKKKIDVGVAIYAGTKVSSLSIPKGVRHILVLSVHPGPAGQIFDTRACTLISFLRKQYPRVILTVDGGITPALVRTLATRGVSRVTSAKYIWKSKNPQTAYQELRNFK
jgi:pentose-5-phosphate-3-epimerase